MLCNKSLFMGAWGTGLYQDDTACDIRDNYTDHLGNGLSEQEATSRILTQFESLLADPVESCVVWFALAAVQWKHGRLKPETCRRALELIDSGADLTRWQPGSRDFAKRRAGLEKLRTQITSPQPVAKKVRKPLLESCDWPVGTVIAYRLSSGNLAMIRVIGYRTDKGGTSPICELLDWSGTDVPTEECLRSAEVKESDPNKNHKIRRFTLFRLDKNAAKRIGRLDFILEPSNKPNPPITGVLWRDMDNFLKRWFLME